MVAAAFLVGAVEVVAAVFGRVRKRSMHIARDLSLFAKLHGKAVPAAYPAFPVCGTETFVAKAERSQGGNSVARWLWDPSRDHGFHA